MIEFKTIVGADINFYGVDGNVFKLGRHVFEAVEDEEDGYRSHLGTIAAVDRHDKIFFKRSLAKVRIEEYDDDYQNGYRLVDLKDSHVWLRVGTDNTDDYYPYFVFEYNPKKPKNSS